MSIICLEMHPKDEIRMTDAIHSYKDASDKAAMVKCY